ncbi:DUF6795 domain-containing protein [Pseudoalteromonas ruthenica]|uniref:DUF6795 domain-containing protein n=1 Tax=Pseudoalteromonas ruthenica TaxID=151081 RepID=UPI00110BAE17|nr:DUF6795 domain-containing protein [Pseudoalteromonas ruthenica]TMO46431.1 hypothetical protein CWC24_10035 [Pseudoalteromonas ruthenica]TMO50398.1 hypothetical protein CWC23_11750 [Pseudoalteromonas ruthenica]
MFGIFKKQQVDLCSKVQGQLFVSGHPAKGVHVHRTLTYSGEQEFSDSTVTDSEGCFSLPKYSILSRKPNKPFFESFVYQYIYAEYEGDERLIWFAEQGGRIEQASFAKKLSTINCDLNDDEVQFQFNSGMPKTLFCANSRGRWNKDFKIIKVVGS